MGYTSNLNPVNSSPDENSAARYIAYDAMNLRPSYQPRAQREADDRRTAPTTGIKVSFSQEGLDHANQHTSASVPTEDGGAERVDVMPENKQTMANNEPAKDKETLDPVNPDELTPEEQKQTAELKRRDAEVRQHEQAHLAAGGQYVRGGARYEYQQGPDGRRYAVGGEVSIDVGRERTPEATITKAKVVRRAALAPADPSAQDRAVASQASQLESNARREVSQAIQEKTVSASAGAKEGPLEPEKSSAPPVTQPGAPNMRGDDDSSDSNGVMSKAVTTSESISGYIVDSETKTENGVQPKDTANFGLVGDWPATKPNRRSSWVPQPKSVNLSA